ncbi:MAG: protein kinase domain-containing protein, partial [Bryobacteraceae bacterium]
MIAAKGLTFESVTNIGAQVASALAAAHSAGIVHRDIKPANIMVTSERQVKVLDFGLAKMVAAVTPNAPDETESMVQATIPGVVLGTAAYMSPEQTRGETLDGRSDIFSLGCVLYEASTGMRPFRGASMLAILQAIGADTPVSPSTLRPEIPLAFDRLIAACLSKKPSQRPASATEVAQALKSLASQPGPSPVRASDGRSTVAILPFQFRTSLLDDQFLSVALADAVIHRLSASGKLLVRPMASVMKYAGKETEWAQAAHELNVDLVVEGTVQKMGPRVRVLVQAHRVADSFTLHSAKFDGAMEDLFGLQDRIADSVSDALIPSGKSPIEPAAPPTKNPLAYELYLRAVDRIAHMDKFDTQMAIDMLG